MIIFLELRYRPLTMQAANHPMPLVGLWRRAFCRGERLDASCLAESNRSELIQPLWRTVWRFLKKLKIELPYDPTIPLLGIYPEKTIIQKDTRTPMFIAALFTITRSWKQPKCPSTDEWINKEDVVCVYIYIYIHTYTHTHTHTHIYTHTME